MPDSYNERYLPNGPVPSVGGKTFPQGPGPSGRAVGHPTIQQSDGMANLRSNQQTFVTNANATPGGGRSKPSFPGGRDGGDVTSYPDGV